MNSLFETKKQFPKISCFSRVYELIEKSSEIRPIYMKCLRTTSIHGEVDSESVLMNILLRNFMHNNLLDQGMNLATDNLDIWWSIEWFRYEFHWDSQFHSRKNSIKAEKLVSKSQFPENASNNEWARYLYYTGRIKAIQLEYSDAQKTITTGTFYQFLKR